MRKPHHKSGSFFYFGENEDASSMPVHDLPANTQADASFIERVNSPSAPYLIFLHAHETYYKTPLLLIEKVSPNDIFFDYALLTQQKTTTFVIENSVTKLHKIRLAMKYTERKKYLDELVSLQNNGISRTSKIAMTYGRMMTWKNSSTSCPPVSEH